MHSFTLATSYHIGVRSLSTYNPNEKWRCSIEMAPNFPGSTVGDGEGRFAPTPPVTTPCIANTNAWNVVSEITKAASPGTRGGALG